MVAGGYFAVYITTKRFEVGSTKHVVDAHVDMVLIVGPADAVAAGLKTVGEMTGQMSAGIGVRAGVEVAADDDTAPAHVVSYETRDTVNLRTAFHRGVHEFVDESARFVAGFGEVILAIQQAVHLFSLVHGQFVASQMAVHHDDGVAIDVDPESAGTVAVIVVGNESFVENRVAAEHCQHLTAGSAPHALDVGVTLA